MRPNAYKSYLLIFLTVILAFSYIDRNVLSVVQEAIKLDLHLSDTEVGAINGIGYAVFFSLMGIPIARWADRGDRVAIVAITTGVWSVAVMMCGTAGNFVQLFLIRMGVAAGEGGCGPPATSLIPSYFSRGERPRAVARYLLGGYLGATVGYFLGGWLNAAYGWRRTFMIVGAPGLILAALAALTLREPRRNRDRIGETEGVGLTLQTSNLREVLVTLYRLTTLRSVLLFYVAWYFAGWGLQLWSPTFFIRSHGLTSADVGTGFALAYGSTGLLGSWWGGELASRYASHRERWQLIGAGAAFFLEGLCNACAYVIPNHNVAFAAIALGNLFESMAVGPIAATVQTLVPPHMRATAQTLVTVLPNFLGLGLGPLAVGAMSDAFQPILGAESLRYALLILCPIYGLAAFYLWRASVSATGELAATLSHVEVAATTIVVQTARHDLPTRELP